LVLGSWFLVLGSWFLVLGSWFLVLGSWFLVLGSWFLVLGSWFSVLNQENAMDLLQLLILLVIAGICGAVAELIVGFSPPGLHVMLVSIIIGVIGAFIGAWIAGTLNLPPITEIRVGTIRLNLLYTIIGSTLLLVLLQALRSGRRWLWINRK
jgi:uncharacterized membrane protein YeaQ/YmgE (transglycosylase-associated protein family)